MAFLPPLAGVAFFLLHLLGNSKKGVWQRVALLATLSGIPPGVLALDAMSRNASLCLLCLGVWGCFVVVAAGALRGLIAGGSRLTAVRSLASVAVCLVVGLAAAVGTDMRPVPNPNCDPEGHCCEVRCWPIVGGSILYVANGYDRCYDQQGQGCVWKQCTMRVYDLKDCEGTWDPGQYSRKCCDWRIPPPQ